MAPHGGQPATHLPEPVSQVLPAPQSPSDAQPQVPLAKQAAPVPSFEQSSLLEEVHSTHFFPAPQRRPAGQSPSFRHSTQAWGSTVVSHAFKGAAQSLFDEQGSATQWPIAPDFSLQVWPEGQPLRSSAVEHPAIQIPGEPWLPLQTRPDPGGPHCESSVQPQTPSDSTQIGFLPPHFIAFVAVHSVH